MRPIAASAVTAAILLALTPAAPAPAAPAMTPLDHLPALKGGYFPLQSREAEHLYHIYVRLPEGYETDTGRSYPVVYLLDGDSLFPIIATNHLFLTYDDGLPEAIVVGISYGSFAKPTNRRHIDFMPPAEGVAPQDAGATAFHRFLKNELLPAVEGRYRVDPERRILFGQSRAGAMILYSAFRDPDLFWARIASNASFEPGREIWFGTPAEAQRRDLRFVLATGSEEEPGRRASALEWSRYWNGRAGAPWLLNSVEIPGGTHAANTPDVYRTAMRWLFAGGREAR